MQFYTHTLPSGAALVGYLRDETTEMPAPTKQRINQTKQECETWPNKQYRP